MEIFGGFGGSIYEKRYLKVLLTVLLTTYFFTDWLGFYPKIRKTMRKCYRNSINKLLLFPEFDHTGCLCLAINGYIENFKAQLDSQKCFNFYFYTEVSNRNSNY